MWLARLAIPLFVVVLALAVWSSQTSPYAVIRPAGTYEIGPRLRVPDEQRKEMGRLAFTAVYADVASWAEAAAARLSRSTELVPADQVRPPGVSQQEINESNQRQIDESKPVAAAVALRAAGYPVTITGKGAEVGGVIEGMPADGVLQKGDVIVAVDGRPVETTNDLIEAIRRHQVGERVSLAVMREGQPRDLEVGTRSSTTEPGRPAVGVYVSTVGFDVRLPFPVDIDTDGVGGPSAGFMFSLGVLDAVTEGDLTRGYYVAGTGTIATDGTVGPIGGAAEKVIAAERDGAQVFLVPQANAEEARKRARSIRVAAVQTLEDAVRFLCGLDPRPGAASVRPAPCS